MLRIYHHPSKFLSPSYRIEAQNVASSAPIQTFNRFCSMDEVYSIFIEHTHPDISQVGFAFAVWNKDKNYLQC